MSLWILDTDHVSLFLAENLTELYTRFWIALNYFRDVRVVNFNDAANACHQKLLKDNSMLSKKRLQKDMRIAAITLSLGAMLVTRNYKDFAQVPGLAIEDWT